MLPVRGPQWEPSRPSSPQMGNVTWRAVRVQQARIKSGHPPLRQIGHGSTDRGSISDSQADSAGSIPVTRSKCEKCCSTSESDCISQAGQRSFASENGTRAITRALSHLGEWPLETVSSQADSAGSIPVTRSTREKRCSTSESDSIFQVDQRSFGARKRHSCHYACH